MAQINPSENAGNRIPGPPDSKNVPRVNAPPDPLLCAPLIAVYFRAAPGGNYCITSYSRLLKLCNDFRSKRATTKMSLAINALLCDTDDDEEMQTDTSQLLDEEEYEKNNGMILFCILLSGYVYSGTAKGVRGITRGGGSGGMIPQEIVFKNQQGRSVRRGVCVCGGCNTPTPPHLN